MTEVTCLTVVNYRLGLEAALCVAPPCGTGQKIKYLFPPGYANEVGEAFRSLVPAAVVWLSYGVSSSYVLADAIDKGKKAGEVSVS